MNASLEGFEHATVTAVDHLRVSAISGLRGAMAVTRLHPQLSAQFGSVFGLGLVYARV